LQPGVSLAFITVMTKVRELLTTRGSPLIMGIVNCTPDSFFDGGRHHDPDSARAHALELVSAGADLVDVGAESTRPGAEPISSDEQLRRLGTLIEDLAAEGVLVSIDTTSLAVARHAVERGAVMVNSVSLEPAEELASIACAHGAALTLMHCRGAMRDMAGFSVYADDAYGDVVADVARELSEAAARAVSTGMRVEDVFLDPGLGFAKNARQSLELLARLPDLSRHLSPAEGHRHPLLVGPSRKSFLAAAGPEARLGGSVAAAIACARGGADVVRVHDVREVRQALDVEAALTRAALAPRGSERAAAGPSHTTRLRGDA
jgi:dihydropteroate synthase